MIKHLLSLLIGIVLFATNLLLAKGVYANYDLQVMDKGSMLVGEIVTFYDNEKMRMEIALNRGKEPLEKIIHIVDIQKNKSYTLFNESKTYVELKYPKSKKNTLEKKYKPSNQTKTIAGFSCEVFGKIKKDFVETVCISQELYNKHKNYRESFRHIGQKQSYYMNDIKGFPLEYQITVDGKIQSKFKLKQLKEKNIKAQLFVIPKFYKKIESLKKKAL
ncbi:DUF4412 domain-containing protein [bacterium]|nr:DUF4412 domain-containing protein [bacterium]